ncbi:MAG: phosphate signaling complex protein PhoU [Pseudomonadota bacterium]|jgi:phosphate transport system protein|nr:phosphate signaling complex protein PhoU [Pseudomonadota bacterium]
MQEHTVKAFDEDITRLRGLIAEMGGLAEVAIQRSLEALVKGDDALAKQVIKGDKRIDALESEIDKLAIRVIALRAPMADDLREVIAALKIAGVVERIGDYSKNIAKASRQIEAENRKKFEPLTLLPAMAEVAAEMVHDVLTAYAARDAELAKEVIETDAKVDAFYNSIFRNLVSHMVENPATISNAAQLLFVARNLERIGDHATNVAEMVHFAATGSYYHDDDSSDDDNRGTDNVDGGDR